MVPTKVGTVRKGSIESDGLVPAKVTEVVADGTKTCGKVMEGEKITSDVSRLVSKAT